MNRRRGSRWLTPDQASRRLNVCTETVYRYIRRGHLHARRLPGGHLRIREEALDTVGEPEATVDEASAGRR